jgi:hypothetical protein
MRLTFLVCVGAVALLFVTLCRLELTAKRAVARLRRLHRRSEPHAPAAPQARRRPRAEIRQALQ